MPIGYEPKDLQKNTPEKTDNVSLKKEPAVIPGKPSPNPPQGKSEISEAEILVLSVTDLPFASPATQKYQVLIETSQLLQLNKKYKLVL